MPATPGQAPAVYARWFRLVYTKAPADNIARAWRGLLEGEREFWHGLERADFAAGRDEARSDYNRLRTILLDTSQSDVGVRRRCLAIIATAGTPPVDMPLEARRVHRPGSCQCTPCKVAAAQDGAQ